jgi:hypothetical protein
MGNRFKGGIAPGAMPPLHRYLGNPVLSWLGRTMFGLKGVGDFHCGIRGFNRDRIRQLELCMPGMEFASELVVRASLAHYSIVEVPTTLSPDGRSRPPHLRTWRDGWRHLRFLLVFAPRKTLVWPGFILGLLGAIGTVALMIGPIKIDGHALDVNSLAFTCLAILVGAQLVIFGGFAEIYGEQEGIVHEHHADRWTSILRLEVMVTIGLALILIGLVGSALALTAWGRSGFGAQDARDSIRVVMPSATAIALGVIGIFSGLLTSLLTLRRTPQRAAAAAAAEARRELANSATR